jgi:hypothetical protein
MGLTGARHLLRESRGSGGVQSLILTVVLALGAVGGIKLLASAVGGRTECAGEEIKAMALGTAPCQDSGEGGPAIDPEPPAPTVSDPGAEETDGDQEAPAEDDDQDEGDDGEEDDQSEEPDPLDELLDILADIIGLTDAKKCVTEGDIVACLMTAASALGIFKAPFVIAKLVTALPRIVKAIKRLLAVGKRKRPKPREPECKGPSCARPDKCFAPGTPVHTEGGLVAIEELRVGDLVWSRDDETGEEGYRPITRVFVTPDQPLLWLALEDSEGSTEVLEVTPQHPFRTGHGWVAARDLRAEDEVVRAGGGWLRVTDAGATSRRSTVFNFEVEEFHTYFVGHGAAWVHNDCPDEAEPGGQGGESKRHRKNKRKSNKPKHEKGDERRGRDQGGEKGDKRRRHPPKKKKGGGPSK